MKITFLFGNGFDRRMGLNTGYHEIEKAYCSSKGANQNLQDFKKELSLNSELWSDFESGMGKHTAEFKAEQQDAYAERMRDFSGYLVNYLTEEEKKANYAARSSEINKNFRDFIEKFYSELTRRYQTSVVNLIEQTNQSVSFNFVSFNYTHVLDKCLDLTFKNSSDMGYHVCNNTRYNHTVNKEVLHVHGELPGPIIMGVNDKKQIANESWANSASFCDRYVKPATNQRYGSMVDDDVKTLISQSSIICVFGMSLGETDEMWWKHIANTLFNGNKKLILFGRQKDFENRQTMPGDFFDFEDDLRDRFLKVAKVKPELYQQLEQKIHTIRNTNLLNFKLIEEDQEQTA